MIFCTVQYGINVEKHHVALASHVNLMLQVPHKLITKITLTNEKLFAVLFSLYLPTLPSFGNSK